MSDNRPLSIVSIAAHQDDIELGCLGSLLISALVTIGIVLVLHSR